MKPRCKPTCSHGFRIVGTAERHAKIDGKYIDEVVIEKVLPAGGSLQ